MAIPASKILLAPYNLILDAITREESGLELSGSFIIFDESHNIIPCCHEILSVEICISTLKDVIKGIKEYIMQSENYLLSRTKTRLHEIETICIHILRVMGFSDQVDYYEISDVFLKQYIFGKDPNMNYTKNIFTVNSDTNETIENQKVCKYSNDLKFSKDMKVFSLISFITH